MFPFCLCCFPFCILKIRPMMTVPKTVIRRAIVRITAVAPGGHRHIMTQTFLRAAVKTSLTQPGPADQMHQGRRQPFRLVSSSNAFLTSPLVPMANALTSSSVEKLSL